MRKFRKMPVVIEAVQYRIGEESSELASEVVVGRIRYAADGTVLIDTPEGSMIARHSDWIIRGVRGELYPIKDEIFRATYEAVE